MENRDENCLHSRRSTKGSRRPSYARRIKPPYSYTELIRSAILASPERALTLRQIVTCLKNRFACFCGPYQGWRNSIRHNLSANNCFVKILRDLNKPNGKDNFWTVNENCTCTQCKKGVDPSAVKTVGLTGPYFVDISNFPPLNNVSQFQQVPEFPSIVQSPHESEASEEHSSPSQTNIDPVQTPSEENNTDTPTGTADVNNNGTAETYPNLDVVTSGAIAVDTQDAAVEPTGVVELKRPEDYAIADSSEEKDSLLPTVKSSKNELDNSKWHEMTFTNLDELNFVQPEIQSKHYEEEVQSAQWSKIPEQFSQFVRTPYFQPGQYNYPYQQFYHQNPEGNSLYHSVPQHEFHAMPPPYWMGNYGEQYYPPTQSTATEQWLQYQRSLGENNGFSWTQL